MTVKTKPNTLIYFLQNKFARTNTAIAVGMGCNLYKMMFSFVGMNKPNININCFARENNSILRSINCQYYQIPFLFYAFLVSVWHSPKRQTRPLSLMMLAPCAFTTLPLSSNHGMPELMAVLASFF